MTEETMTHAAQTGAAQTGAAQTGATQTGATQTGATQTGAMQNTACPGIARAGTVVSASFLAAHLLTVLLAATVFSLAAVPALAQVDVLACKPYTHGELRSKIPTFFCTSEKDALAVFELIELRRKKTLSREDARVRMNELRHQVECLRLAPSHISRRTLYQGTGEIACSDTGYKATLWPSLIEGKLSGDGASIWIITNVLVPSPEN